MRRWWIDLELLDDVVLRRRSATQGDHECLDRIPGSALRGWCAAHLYDALGDGAWAAFHGGGVRWLDGLPADRSGLRSVPVPLSWHANKADATAAPLRDGWWQAQHLFNLAAGPVDVHTRPGGFQPKGQRQGHVGAGGEALQTLRRYRLMTAIEHDGQVAEGQLFGYESLAAGQRFVAALEVDDGALDEPAVQAVLQALGGTLRLGRSRSAQYGRVRARVAPAQAATVPAAAEVGTTLHVLLVSDACLRDAEGRPTLTPDAATLGLPAGVELDRRRSFLRSRRYSGWNAYRGGAEMERQVLAAGGVLTLHAPQGFDAETLARLARGIGTERAMGLGEVLLHPRWLRGLQPEFSPRTDDGMATSRSTAAAQGSRAMMPDTPLLRLLARRAGTLEQADRLQAVIDEALTRLAERWQAVRRYLAVPSDRAWGPGASQWGALAAAGARAATLNELREALLGERAGIVSRRLAAAGAPAKPFWDDTVPLADGQSLGLAHWVRDTLGALAQAGEADAPRLDAWQRLCDTVRRQQADLNEAALARLAPRKEAA